MKHGLILDEEEADVGLSRAPDGNGYVLHVAGRRVGFTLNRDAVGTLVLNQDGSSHGVELAVDGDTVWIHLDGRSWRVVYEHPLQRLAELAEGSADDVLRAAMPGSLVSLQVAAGDRVSKGQVLLIMESMKMETTLLAPRDAVVEAIHVESGQTFDKDAVLLSFEAVPAQ